MSCEYTVAQLPSDGRGGAETQSCGKCFRRRAVGVAGGGSGIMSIGEGLW